MRECGKQQREGRVRLRYQPPTIVEHGPVLRLTHGTQ